MYNLNLNEEFDAKINIGDEKRKKISSGNNNNSRKPDLSRFWEWIEWDDIDLVGYHGRGFFGEIYSALWISGPLTMWNWELDGLKCIHREKLCHGNLHYRNMLIDNKDDLLDSLGSGIRPCTDVAHDEKLAYKIIANGKRPKIFENNFPKIFTDLMRRCWDNDPKKRSIAQQLFKIAGKWVSDI
nr:9350_t:CDS:2 [Entrophospora candida]